MSIEEKRRAAFEASYEGKANFERNHWHPDFYAELPTRDKWGAWNAALDSVVIELPQDNYYEDAASVALDDCRHAIESAGLKVKP